MICHDPSPHVHVARAVFLCYINVRYGFGDLTFSLCQRSSSGADTFLSFRGIHRFLRSQAVCVKQTGNYTDSAGKHAVSNPRASDGQLRTVSPSDNLPRTVSRTVPLSIVSQIHAGLCTAVCNPSCDSSRVLPSSSACDGICINLP